MFHQIVQLWCIISRVQSLYHGSVVTSDKLQRRVVISNEFQKHATWLTNRSDQSSPEVRPAYFHRNFVRMLHWLVWITMEFER